MKTVYRNLGTSSSRRARSSSRGSRGVIGGASGGSSTFASMLAKLGLASDRLNRSRGRGR